MVEITIKTVLRDYFHQKEFRELQEEIINEALRGKDLLVILPTGYGKSLTFQVPAVYESLQKASGFYIVISPLLALINDQVKYLQSIGIEAFSINSEIPREKRNQIMKKFQSGGKGCLLYVSPELCLSDQFNAFLVQQKNRIRRFVIDEAHCAVEWGADFRKDYSKLGSSLRRQFKQIPFMALTGTASPQMRAQISSTLNLNPSFKKEFVAKVHRPHLHYEVRYVEDQNDRVDDLLKFLKMYWGRIALLNRGAGNPDGTGYPGCGLVYCRSRASTEKVAQEINSHFKGKYAAAYHAGLSKTERDSVMRRWIDGDVSCPLVVATIAFGLGVDKPDTRFVIHFNMPQNMEAYVQQTGRGGRDRNAARCILYYSTEDARMCQSLARNYTSSDARKATEALLKYAVNTTECRHQKLGMYFGDGDGKKHCHYACDFCKMPRRLQQRYDEWFTSQV